MKKNKVIFYLINILIIITVSLLTAYKIVEENGKETLLHLKEISLVAILVLSFMFIINYLFVFSFFYNYWKTKEELKNINGIKYNEH